MQKNHFKKSAIIIPCYNEASQVGKVIETIPEYITNIIVIDDKSTDNTKEVIEGYAKKDVRVIPIFHEVNQGVGGAVASGYRWARDHNVNIAVVMDGDGQMDPVNLKRLMVPISNRKMDYVKGNRLKYPGAYKIIPKKRFFGNQILSLFTKIASGYWHINDAQSAYTAISKKALRLLDWDSMYKRYGYPNEILAMLNTHGFRVCEITIKPVYGVGEKSKMCIKKVMITIPILLMKSFFRRIFQKYVIKNFS